MPFEKAVADMTRRAPENQDLKIFALSVIVQKETGGNLVEIIEKIADTVRGREKFQGKLRGLTAEGRMSSYILGGLPFVSLLFMLFGNRAYLMPMFEEPIGHYVLALRHHQLGARLLVDAQDDQGEDVDGPASRHRTPTMLVAAGGRPRRRDRDRVGRARPVRRPRDEVIERLERATGGGWTPSSSERERARKDVRAHRQHPAALRAAGEAGAPARSCRASTSRWCTPAFAPKTPSRSCWASSCCCRWSSSSSSGRSIRTWRRRSTCRRRSRSPSSASPSRSSCPTCGWAARSSSGSRSSRTRCPIRWTCW